MNQLIKNYNRTLSRKLLAKAWYANGVEDNMSHFKNAQAEQKEKPALDDEFYKEILAENSNAVKAIKYQKETIDWFEQEIAKALKGEK